MGPTYTGWRQKFSRKFPFPINLTQEQPQEIPDATDARVLEHVSVAIPLMKHQQTVLHEFIQDRREHHQELKNRGQRQNTFKIGDLVIVWKQVQAMAATEFQKLLQQAKGPYCVLEKLSASTYQLQKVPFLQNQG